MAVAARRVANSFKELLNDPIEGVLAEIPDDSNMFLWNIWMEGPPGSPYEGGIFQLQMDFPDDFPMNPPKLTFVSQFWHPNVYREGEVCISILHPPGEDELSGELASERWMPTHTVASIMLSIISMLNDPNLSSPANVEASVMYRDRRAEFNARCEACVSATKGRVPEHIKIPHPESNELERKRAIIKHSAMNEDDFGVDSIPDEYSEDGGAMEDDDDDGEDVEVDVEVDDDELPPRKSKASSPSEASKSKGDKKGDKKSTSKKDGKAKSKPKREMLIEVDDVETDSGSSSLDAKELENLLQPDAEFKQWKRYWQTLTIWKATNKGWTVAKSGGGGSTSKSARALQGDFSILTYNVLRHSTAEGAHRATEQLKILRDANAHIMVLNDVTPSFQQLLGEQAAFLGYYSVFAQQLASELPGNTSTSSPDTLVKGANTLVISKLRILQAQILPLPSRTERNLIRIECEGTRTHSVVVIAAHLDDSPRDLKLRVQQLAQLNKACEGFTHAPHVQFYAGDLGLCPGTKEHKAIDSNLADAWSSVHPGEPGLTYDPAINKMIKVLTSSPQATRRDRIMFRSDSLQISPTDAQIIGRFKMNHKYKGSPMWPSDHFALMASFTGLEDTGSSKKAGKCVIS